MANQDSCWIERETEGDFAEAAGPNNLIVDHLAERVNRVATLQTGLNQSLPIQNAPIQRLFNKTQPMTLTNTTP